MLLHLVRHGRTASNVAGLLDTAHPGAPLDRVGRAQAAALVGRLDGVRVDAVYSSDIVRAVQTGTPLAQVRELLLTTLPGLREIPAGDLEMLDDWRPYIDVLRAWGEGEPGRRRPGGEDAFAFFDRFDAAVAAIMAGGHGHALLVSHGAALRTWLSGRVAGLTPLEVAHRHLGNTAIVTIVGEPDDWRLVSWDDGVTGDTPHSVPPARPDADARH